jgi:hypothetical protein
MAVAMLDCDATPAALKRKYLEVQRGASGTYAGKSDFPLLCPQKRQYE